MEKREHGNGALIKMIKHYRFMLEGSSANGNSWTTSGSFDCEFPEVWDRAMEETFHQLTKGLAVYGKHGLGCRGPYDIHRVEIKQEKQ